MGLPLSTRSRLLLGSLVLFRVRLNLVYLHQGLIFNVEVGNVGIIFFPPTASGEIAVLAAVEKNKVVQVLQYLRP